MTDMTTQKHAKELHDKAIIIDGHSDILMPIADQRMRLATRFELPDPAGWQPPLGWPESEESKFYGMTPHSSYFETMGHYDLPRFREGGLTAQAMAIFIDASKLDQALYRALQMIYSLEREFEENQDFSPIVSSSDIRKIKQENGVGGILTFEGFEPIGSDLSLLNIFYKLGLRMASMTHSRRNYFADGTQPGINTAGLTRAGRSAIQHMNKLGIVIDLAHLALPGCWDVLELSQAPVVLSHMSPRHAFRQSPPENSISDDTKKLLTSIAEKEGVIGVIAWSQSDLSSFLNDIEAVTKIVGPSHVGLGTDFFGLESAPVGFTGMDQLPNVTQGLVERGFSDEDILKILGENYLRVFEKVW